MRVREIGSEYHYSPLYPPKREADTLFSVTDDTYTFSGRTALETVLCNVSGVKKALLPSYCCNSMIEPFRAANINVDFYDVFWDEKLKTKLEIQKDIDLILWCNYFGFKQEMPTLDPFIARGGIVVEDITHSYLSGTPFHPQSQYVIASVRKWFPLICGGYCASRIGKLQYKPHAEVPREYTETKMLAMKQKAAYLNQRDETLKDQYLQNFSQSNHWLAKHYSGLKMDSASNRYLDAVDTALIKSKRIENASVIYEYLHTQKRFLPIFPQTDMDCPLFVPIICADKTERDKLRQKLTAEEIYCPVHWPKPDYPCHSNLYDLELSLICDQRYGVADMKRMMQVVCK